MANQVSGAGLKRQILFWFGILVIFVLFLFVFSSILLPFVAGMALAYFLDPVADQLEKLGLNRMMATVVILIAFLVLLTLAAVILIPVVVSQASDFIARIPEYLTQLQQAVANSNAKWVPGWIASQVTAVKGNFAKVLADGAGFLAALFAGIWDSGKTLLDVASLFVVTPVVAFYLLLDWDRMVAKVDAWVPRDYLTDVRQIASEMDAAIAGFVRGQGSVCLILGTYYGVGLTVAGLNFGLLIGLFAGVISFIPYIGSMVGLVLAVGVALVQFWPDYFSIILVLCVFFSGQFIKGNILQPKLVGSKVGLHPVWLMFALFAFGAMFGFVGLIVAVPAAAAVGVLVRFALSRYLQSDLYQGEKAKLPSEQNRNS